MSNQKGSPWTRAFVETFVIVSSILLAFAIDAAWDSRQAGARGQAALRGIQADFGASEEVLAETIDLYQRRDEAFRHFTASSPEQLSALPPDSATVVYRLLFSARTFEPTLAEVEALIAAGDLGLIPSPELRRAVTEFLRIEEDHRAEREEVTRLASAVLEATAPHGGPWNSGPGSGGGPSGLPRLTGSDLGALRADREFVGLVGVAHHWATIYWGELAEAATVVREIIDLVDLELGGRAP